MVLLYRAQRERYHRKPHLHTKEVDPPKTNSVPLASAIQKGDQNPTHWYTSWHRLRPFPPSSILKSTSVVCWLPSQCSSTFAPAEATGRGCSSVGAYKGRLHFHSDSWRATGCLSPHQHPPWLSYAWTHWLQMCNQPSHCGLLLRRLFISPISKKSFTKTKAFKKSLIFYKERCPSTCSWNPAW